MKTPLPIFLFVITIFLSKCIFELISSKMTNDRSAFDLKNETTKKKSKKPPNTSFRQQRLKAWHPIFTPKTILPLFLAIGTIFAPMGALLLWASSEAEEISIDYTDCAMSSPTPPVWSFLQRNKFSKHFKKSSYGPGKRPAWQHRTVQVPYDGKYVSTTLCSIQFDILNDIGPPVFLYYRLTDFYQNHRRYVKSLDRVQLKGKARSQDMLASDCDPLRVDKVSKKAYYPCGLIANSYFNDSFTSPVLVRIKDSDPLEITYPMTTKGVAWASDRELYGRSSYNVDDVTPPPNWSLRYPNGYTNQTGLPDLGEDESFQVWMRTAGLPKFIKLVRRNDDQVMRAGRYQVDIRDYFPVKKYNGTKSLVIASRTVIGGRNPFLGIAYMVVGMLCVSLMAILTTAHLIKPRPLGDYTYLSWNKELKSQSALARTPTLSSGTQ